MSDFSALGKWMVFFGVVLAALGAVFLVLGRAPFLGRLPGDLKMEGEHFKFYFPLTTCLLLSALGSLILWIFSKFK